MVEKVDRKNKVIKHVGTARTPSELIDLVDIAKEYIDRLRIKSGVVSFFDSRYTKSELENILSQLEFTKILDTPIYHFLSKYYLDLGFGGLRDQIFKDLVIARIVKPVSKRQTKEVLKNRFGKNYSLSKMYRRLKIIHSKKYQERIEKYIQKWIGKGGKTLTVVFFDVTTLYYESFDEDDFRKIGFSKDNKVGQPQIVVGLLVSRVGLPLHLDIFEGSTFEGHTMLPVVEESLNLIKNKELVIVADAGMLSQNNLEMIESKGLKYIVGARMRNLKGGILNQVISIQKKDGEKKRIDLGKNKVLIISYSKKRAGKDKATREKQIKNAKELLKKGKATRRYKFLTSTNAKPKLNDKLIKKEEKLEGLKGYVTNATQLTDGEVVKRYKELWQVERAFRMSKSDLKARPIFHTLKESIEAHLTIVFTALTIARLIELTEGRSLKRIIDTLTQVKEVFIKDPISGEEVSKYTNLTREAENLLRRTKLFGSLK